MCLHGISWQRAPLSLLSPLVVISQVWTAFPEPCAVPAVPGCSAAGDRCHSALVQVLDTEPAAEPLPSPQPSQLSLQLLLSDFPAASATPCCSRGPLAGWLCGNAGQCRCCCSCAVPGCAPPVGEERRESSPQAQRAQAGHRPTCPCAKTICKMVFSSKIPALLPLSSHPPTAPATLSLLFAINSAGPGEIGSFHPPSHSPLSLPAAMPSSLPSPCAADPVTEIK